MSENKKRKAAGRPLQYISHEFPPLFVANKDNVKACLHSGIQLSPVRQASVWKPGRIIMPSILRLEQSGVILSSRLIETCHVICRALSFPTSLIGF